jgi:amidohydrolase
LHDELFLPGDDAVTRIAHALVAGYLAALEAESRQPGGRATVTP